MTVSHKHDGNILLFKPASFLTYYEGKGKMYLKHSME